MCPRPFAGRRVNLNLFLFRGPCALRRFVRLLPYHTLLSRDLSRRRHLQLGVLGDGDPVDVVEIGSAKLASGWVTLLSRVFGLLRLVSVKLLYLGKVSCAWLGLDRVLPKLRHRRRNCFVSSLARSLLCRRAKQGPDGRDVHFSTYLVFSAKIVAFEKLELECFWEGRDLGRDVHAPGVFPRYCGRVRCEQPKRAYHPRCAGTIANSRSSTRYSATTKNLLRLPVENSHGTYFTS